jgi:hypothetical protein
MVVFYALANFYPIPGDIGLLLIKVKFGMSIC